MEEAWNQKKMWLNENCFLNLKMQMALMICNLNQLINWMLRNTESEMKDQNREREEKPHSVLYFCSCWCIKMTELLPLFLCSSITIFPISKGECCTQGQPLEAAFAFSVEVIRCQHSLIASNYIMDLKFLKGSNCLKAWGCNSIRGRKICIF